MYYSIIFQIIKTLLYKIFEILKSILFTLRELEGFVRKSTEKYLYFTEIYLIKFNLSNLNNI